MIGLDSGVTGLVFRGLWTAIGVYATKGAILFLIVYCVTRLIRSLSATRRHTFWLLVLLVLAVLPAAQLLLPVIHVPFLKNDTFSPAARTGSFSFGAQLSAHAMAGTAIPAGIKAGGSPMQWLPQLLSGIWALLALIFAGRPIAARIALENLARSANHPVPPAVLLHALADRIGVRRAILLDHPRVAIPFTFGTLTPRVVLPQSWRAWSERRLTAVLTHELWHIKRRDSLSNAAAQLICACMWFNPFIWIARAFMLRDAELSCDGEVLRSGITGSEYASTILEILRGAHGPHFVRSSTCTLGRRRMAKERIYQILFSRTQARTLAASLRGRVFVLGFCVLLPLFAVSISFRGSETLFGTWQRQESIVCCDQDQYRWNEDGSGRRSFAVLPDVPASTCSYSIEKKWIDPQDFTWYNLKASWSRIPSPLYMLIRLNPEGSLCEVADSLTGYPLRFDGLPGSEKHQLYWRL